MFYVKHTAANGITTQSAKADKQAAWALAKKYVDLGCHTWVYCSESRTVVWDSRYPKGEVFIDLTYGPDMKEKHYRFLPEKGKPTASEQAMSFLKDLASRAVAAGIPACGHVRSCKGDSSFAIQDGSAVLVNGEASWSLI